MLSRGVTEKHMRLAVGRATRVMDLAGIQRLSDVTPSAVQNALAELRRVGRAAKTLNDVLANAGIPYQTQRGFADFHALRHTFITRLIKAGVNPKTAQILARHHDASLTLNLYSHVELIDQVAALRTLPVLDQENPEQRLGCLRTTRRNGHQTCGDAAQFTRASVAQQWRILSPALRVAPH